MRIKYLNNDIQIVKFELESKLDYYTIESIYQFIFNNKKSNDFAYLDNVIGSNTKFVDRKKVKQISSQFLGSWFFILRLG